MRKARPLPSSGVINATAVAAVVAVVIAGCTPGPLSTPTTGGPLGSGPALGSEAAGGEVETARKQLEGTWDLVSLESVPPSGGATRVPLQASGTLVYDKFGNLTIDAHTTDPAAPVAAREKNMLSFKGRAVIDVANKELKLMDLTGNVDPNEVLSPERRRRFEFANNDLKLSSFDDKGVVTSVALWHRRN